ncbi:bromodomain adjacent to zinc finger domain protein 1A isoform X2 [Euwallacea similis]|uniref:bromodomain adjacent to zinc finger domain protein 1A isoform X2 n=1 Tax=Euwallacea similis TaxID=1736056 RepID=UPI00344E7839
MPLLRKKMFERHEEPEYLRDDDEVFYCEITNEIFKDYHEFSERMFLCNSMVWTCSMTGKSNLTYQEAEESENHALQCLKEFPSELKVPILYLSTLTKRTFFGEMAEDIFIYTKDRYFAGENVEASFTSNKWKDCHIISVIAPDEKLYANEVKSNGSKSPSEKGFVPSASLYKYEVEHINAADSRISEIMIVDHTQLRRKKSQYSRDKVKLFLKQNVAQDSRGIFVIKPEILDKYEVKRSIWETLFDGPLPNFQSSKNFEKAVNGKKKQRQETMAKYLQKNGLVMKKEGRNNKEKKGNLLEAMKLRQEEFQKQKQLNEEQKAIEKQKKKDDALKLAQYCKDWFKPKEDLELEDHQELPIPTPVKCKVPNRYFGDMISILEFVHQFPKLLSTKDFFPGGFALEVLERALIEKEVAGPLTDLIQMLLVAIFNCQEEESNSYNIGTETLKDIKEENLSTTPTVKEGTHLATLASKWPLKYQGLPLSRLPLYSLTVSEVLRLHLLSSGARIKDNGARWRYAQRGGYTSEDDPGLHMRLHQTYILRALGTHNVVQLPINDKIKIILCLMNQILTYADVRDIIEEQIEKVKAAKIEFKALKVAKRKRELELVTQKTKLTKEMGDDAEKLKFALEKLEMANERKQAEMKRKMEKCSLLFNEKQTFLGRDRAFRKYIKIESIPGLFVSWEEKLAGTCMDKITIQNPNLANASKRELMTYIKESYQTKDIKIEPSLRVNGETFHNSPSKSPKRTNNHKDLLLCTADPQTCPVHTEISERETWAFFHEKEQIGNLIKALNTRGLREGKLKELLEREEDQLEKLVLKTPVGLLNPTVVIKTEEVSEKPVRLNGANKKKDRYEDANLGYPPNMDSEEVLENALIENILEMEEKIHGGSLGTLKIKDRDKWRNCLQNKNYDEFKQINESKAADKENKHLTAKKSEDERSRSNSPEIPDKKEETELYQDPGKFLGTTIEINSENSEKEKVDESVLIQSENTQKAIGCLAQALCHVAEAVDPRHLKRPLGHSDVRANNKHKDPHDVMERWEKSLLASTSFSQVFLHYGTLDPCVMWSRSALLARCQICRRQKDSENMLLCDSCNLGHHMYCLKPKLTAVPKGDWFCDKCKKEKAKQEKLLSPEPVKRVRRIFVEEEADEEEENDSGNEEGGEEEEESDSSTGESEMDDDNKSDGKLDLCKICGSGGETIQCEKCEHSFHKECTSPPMRRLPRTPWKCPQCSNKGKKRTYKQAEENGYSSDSEEEEVVKKRVLRRDEKRDNLPLNNAALQEFLTDVMKHDAAWPFLRPVYTKEVPDYYQIISEPMDFGTIKYKLNIGKYSADSQVMRDVALIFENCITYNSSDDEVYKCGRQLSTFVCEKAEELGLPAPSELGFDDDADENLKAKKRRRM